MNKTLSIALGLIASATGAFAQSLEFDNQTAHLVETWNASEARDFGGTDNFAAYSNLTTYSGQVSLNGGATSGITRMQMDDLTFGGNVAGQNITQVKFSVGNLNTVAVSARPRLRFWFSDGSAGAPGTYYNGIGFTFNPITFGAGSANIYTFNTGPGFVVPTNAMWAGITFDNVGATATTAQLNNLGQLIFGPPTAGSSQDQIFTTTAPGSFFNAANPAGATSNFGGAPLANLGWEFSTVPEPGAFIAVGAGLAGLLLRRRSRLA